MRKSILMLRAFIISYFLFTLYSPLTYAQQEAQAQDATPPQQQTASTVIANPDSSVIASAESSSVIANPDSSVIASAEGAKQSLEEGLNQRMGLDLRDMDLVDALKFLAMKGNINIIAGKDVAGRVSLFLKDVTIKDALDIILVANNLAFEKRGDILYVMTDAEYKAIHGENFKDTRKIKMLKLKYANPAGIFKSLEIIKSDIGKLIVDEESGSVVLMDTPEKLKEMSRAVANLDRPSLTKTFNLQYVKAKDAQALLSSRLDAKKTGLVTINEKSNQIIITAMPERMKEAEEIIKRIDQKTKEVLINARVIKVVLSDDYDMGIDWDKVFDQVKINALKSVKMFPLSAISLEGAFAFPSGTSNYGSLVIGSGGDDLTATIKALQEFGETRNLSSPSIAVVNGEEAKIHVGTSQAYVTTTISTGGTTATTAAQVQFVDVGVMLVVTPYINDDGYVTMKIKPEVSSVDSTLSYQIAASVTNTVPIVARTTAETTVMVQDGKTVIIGGLRKDEKLKTVDKFPILGDLPYIGAAFRKVNEDLEKTELVVFITPHIIYGDVDAADEVRRPKGIRGYKSEPVSQ